MIIYAKYAAQDNFGVLVRYEDGTEAGMPVNDREIKEFLADGNTIEPADPPLPPPTNEELIDMAGPVLVAFLKAFAKREGLTLQQIKAAIVAEM